MQKWRSAIKTQFFTLAQSVVNNVLRVEHGDDVAVAAGNTALFNHWKHHMNAEGIAILDLGSIDEVPTLPSRNASKASINIALHSVNAAVTTSYAWKSKTAKGEGGFGFDHKMQWEVWDSSNTRPTLLLIST